MMSSFWVSITTICLLNVANSATISPDSTLSNSTHEYYVNSLYTASSTNFQFDDINCGTSYCHIICDEENGCFELNVDATNSDILIIECGLSQSCKTITINGPSTLLDIECESIQSCRDGKIYASKTMDINLKCNSTTTTTTDASCYNILLNATDSTTVNIDCFGQNSCYNSRYHLNNTQYATINGEGQYAMYSTRLYAYNMQNKLNINCGYYSCRLMYIYADYMMDTVTLSCNDYYSCHQTRLYAKDMQSSATVNCNGDNACNVAYVYCPDNQQCNIDCTASNACYNTQIYVPNNQYDDLNLFCDPLISTSCYSADLQCDNGGSTQLSWDVSNNYFKCDTYGCCPMYEGNITCSSGIACNINCASDVCRNHHIDGTQASSLTVDCGGLGCSGSKILCPIGAATSCNITTTITSGIAYTTIETGTGNATDSFVLDCGTTTGCQYTAISLRSTSIKDVSIHCTGSTSCSNTIFDVQSSITNTFNLLCSSTGCQYTDLRLDGAVSINNLNIDCMSTYSCRYSKFNIASVITNTFNLLCSSSNACYNMDINIPSTSINTLYWNCPLSSSCYAASMDTGINTVINSYTLNCGASACSSIDINAANATIGDLTVTCTYCLSMDFDAKISNSAIINCQAQDSCDSANINLVSTTPNTNVNIYCTNPSISSSASYGACYSSYWYIYGYMASNGDKNNNLTLECSQYDCYSAYFYGYDLLNAEVKCDAPYSCRSARINIPTAEKLDLRCSESYSCRSSYVYCPYREEKSCKIECAGDVSTTYSCNSMQIYVPDSYSYDYLDIVCPSDKIFPNNYGCVGLDVNCNDGSKSQAPFAYNYTLNEYECLYSGISYCCPYFKGSKVTPCVSGTNCIINCGSSSINCASSFIDGTEATYLSVDCSSYDCQYALIHCPVGGCSINCNGQNSCYDTQIVYNGELMDYGKVSVNCTEYYSCYSTVINAQYADQVTVDCSDVSSTNYICYSTTLNAQYANQVILRFKEQYSSQSSSWYVDNAKNVTLKASGSYAFYSSYLYAANAETVTVFCSADSGSGACQSSYWYVPYNAVFNCYGDGCYQLQTIYMGTNTASGLQMNMFSCGQCNSFEDCIYRTRFYCNSNSYSDWYYGNDYTTTGYCNTNNCGCNDVESNAAITHTVSDPNCYTTLTSRTCTDENCVITCDYNTGNGNCYNTVIDGSTASYLTVNCIYSTYCNNAVILCPVGGCTINCNYTSVCQNAQIYFTGTKSGQIQGINGNVKIRCTQDSSCYSMVINAQYADTVDIECIASKDSYSYICYSTTLNAQYANKVKLYFYEVYGSYDSTWNVQNVSNVIFTAWGQNAFYSSYLHAEYAQYVHMKCASSDYNYACYSSYYYIPYNTTLNCYGNGCNSIGTVYSTDYSSGLRVNVYGCEECAYLGDCVGSFQFYYNRYSGSSYSGSTWCYPSSYTYCGYYSDVLLTYVETSDDGECYGNVVAISDSCSSGSDCKYDCYYSSQCANGYIDGSQYTYLTVECDGESYCQNTRIVCPDGGCNIQCKYASSCNYAEIVYSGTRSNYAEVKVECSGSDSCASTKIYADYADTVSLKCVSTEGGYNYVCNGLTLNATYANTVNLVGNYQYGFYSSYIYANNATSVHLSARGSYGFYSSYLNASNAGSVSITCTAEEWESAACYSSYWYLPYDTSINCYGPGCNGMGSIYVRDTAAGFTFNINACGDCDDKADCLGSLTFYCGSGYSTAQYYYGYSYSGMQDCYDSSTYDVDCGCESVIDGISYSDESSDDNCYSPALSGSEIAAIVGGVIGGVVGLILLCVICRWCQKKNNSNYPKRHINNVNVAKPVIVQQKPVTNTYGTPGIAQPVIYKTTPMFVSPGSAANKPIIVAANYTANTSIVHRKLASNLSAVSSLSAGTTNSIQLSEIKAEPAAAPSAPSMETPVPDPSAPGFDNDNNDDVPPSYDNFEADAPPPAYSDVMAPAQTDQYTPNAGEGRVTNM